MFLKKLIIENHKTVIREIVFHEGINLIVDETASENKLESGNNVGKTTVLRLIDFCLGGDGKNIYHDSEFKEKGININMKKFLKNKGVIITLILKKDLKEESSLEIKIRKNFLSYKNKIQEINGKNYSKDEFTKRLQYLIFETDQEKPTFRQIISKNIRDEKNRLQHTVKVLHSTTKQEEYEALYFFWLGISNDSASRKQKLTRQLADEEKLKQRLSKEHDLSYISQSLEVVKRDIVDLEQEKKDFTINENHENDLKQFNCIKKEINRLSNQYTLIKLRKELILESKSELKEKISDINTERIKLLYQEAEVLIPNLQKRFEDTLAFHNRMLEEKSRFINQELPEVEQDLEENNQKLTDLLYREKTLSKKLQKSDALEWLQSIIDKLSKSHEKKGNLEEQKRQLEESLKKIEEFKSDLEKINSVIDSQEESLEARIAQFNEYFSNISSKLYDERFILSQSKNKKGYELNISTLSGNPGTGKKKGEIVAFDLAYIQFAEKSKLKCLHFVLHDQIETVHDNQISSLLTEIIKPIKCQYILPVLRDKLPTDTNFSKLEILSLSQSSKLFKV